MSLRDDLRRPPASGQAAWARQWTVQELLDDRQWCEQSPRGTNYVHSYLSVFPEGWARTPAELSQDISAAMLTRDERLMTAPAFAFLPQLSDQTIADHLVGVRMLLSRVGA